MTAYFLLDDYASWLAQPESRIADILALNVEEREEGVRVVISIVESKCVAAEGLAKARRDSKDQLLATQGMFREALFGDPGRLDRDVWLARLADMLVDADIPPGMTGLMERSRAQLKKQDLTSSPRPRDYFATYLGRHICGRQFGDSSSSTIPPLASNARIASSREPLMEYRIVFDCASGFIVPRPTVMQMSSGRWARLYDVPLVTLAATSTA